MGRVACYWDGGTAASKMLLTPERNLLSDDLIEVLEYLRVRWNTLHPSVDITDEIGQNSSG